MKMGCVDPPLVANFQDIHHKSKDKRGQKSFKYCKSRFDTDKPLQIMAFVFVFPIKLNVLWLFDMRTPLQRFSISYSLSYHAYSLLYLYRFKFRNEDKRVSKIFIKFKWNCLYVLRLLGTAMCAFRSHTKMRTSLIIYVLCLCELSLYSCSFSLSLSLCYTLTRRSCLQNTQLFWIHRYEWL